MKMEEDRVTIKIRYLRVPLVGLLTVAKVQTKGLKARCAFAQKQFSLRYKLKAHLPLLSLSFGSKNYSPATEGSDPRSFFPVSLSSLSRGSLLPCQRRSTSSPAPLCLLAGRPSSATSFLSSDYRSAPSHSTTTTNWSKSRWWLRKSSR